jgi:Cytosol aminopeptidase family, N-terminal domain
MTARLQISLALQGIERIGADVAALGFFRDERPLRGSAGSADWRLCGRLSRLLRDGRLSGERGEAVLLPTRGGLRAPLVVALGLGARGAFDAARCRAAARDAVERARQLRGGSVALALLEAGADAMSLGARLEATLRGTLSAPSMGPSGCSAPLALYLVAPPFEQPAVLAWLRAACRRGLPSEVEILLPEAAIPAALEPHGEGALGRRSLPRSPSVK